MPFDGSPTWWPGAPDALQAGRDARRRLDEDDEVDGAHVDAQLERRRRDERRDAAGLEVLLDLEPLLAGDRAVVGADQLLAGELVQALREPLGQAAAVREDDRAAVRPDELEQARVDRRPDARAHVAERDGPAGLLVGRQDLAEPGHVLDRDDDLELERLAAARVDDLDLAARPDPAEEAGDRLERPLGRRQPDALERRRVRRAEPLEPFQREGQVRPALRAGDRVDLVDDDRLDAAQRLARRAREQQVQALGRRDEDVRRPPRELPPLLLGRVAGSPGDRDPRLRLAEPLRRERRCRGAARAGCARRRRSAP